KNLGGMGDGGILTATDAGFADRLRLFAGHGMRPRYYHQVVGINSRLDTFQAAVLRVKLRHLDAAVEARTINANRYTRLLTEAGLVGEDQLGTPYHDPNARHVWNQYTLRVPGGRRDALRAHLSERKIGSEIYYPVPMHQQECFQDIPFRHDGLEHTEAASAEVLNLPIFPSLTEAEQIRVVDSVASFFQQANRAAA
ncbi:MAG: DegT/DnrJ/EryC1/StrS family aminotransferase, partial [bacterium]|nr:DegT/DnrJ/EryC1/StrS family aminotransferase [bacterium]